MKLRKGDAVVILSGKDKGKTGTISKTLPALNKVIVDGINIVKRASKPSAKQPKGGIVSIPQPIWASKVGIVHPDDSKRASRIGIEIGKDGKKSRVYRQAKNKVIK